MELGNSEKNKLYIEHDDLEYKYIMPENYIDISNKNSAPSIIADLIADKSVVLDVGCSYGLLGKWLKINKDCVVYGIDNDIEVLNFAKHNSQYDDVFLMDLDNPSGKDFERFNELQEIFDYIVLADVLGHLKDPTYALLLLTKKLKSYSNFLISIPNISNIDIILNLIEGRFNYNEFGILDNSHLRFFTKNSFIEWIDSINNSKKLDGFKFQLDFIANTTYISEFVRKIILEKPLLYNLLKSSNPELDVLQNIFSLTKVKKEDRIFNTNGKEDIKPLDKIYFILDELVKISKNYEKDLENMVEMHRIIDEQNTYLPQSIANKNANENAYGNNTYSPDYKYGTNVISAKNRAHDKTEILIVDWGIPQPDMDAGSRAIMFTIECLIDMGAIVKFWPNNLLKDEKYIRRLQDIDVEVFYGHKWIGKFTSLIKAIDLDVILLSRPNIAIGYINEVKQYSRAMSAFYGHDLHYKRFMMQYDIYKDPKILETAQIFQKIEEYLWSKSDIVLYPSIDEVNEVKSKNPEVNAKPVQLYFYDNFPKIDINSLKKRKDILFVAGFGHSPNEDAALWFAKDIFPIIKYNLPNIRLFLVGSNPTENIKKLETDDIIVTGYVTDEKLAEFYSNARVAAVPLRFGAGVKSKVTEALRYGIPLVTTSVGAQGLNDLNSAAFVVDTPEQFADCVIKLLKDDDLWENYARKGQKYAQTNFSKQSMIESLKPLFEKSKKI